VADFPKGRTIYEDVIALKNEIDRIKKETGAKKVTIIAHSRGGLVAEYYTMMYGSQYQDSIVYSYIDPRKISRTKIITGIPRYENDINQIIMLGTPQKGSGWFFEGRESERGD
jgi:triacylglycerol esterase/lipase EstA (alpha/beta hydrolase family)